MNSQIPQQIGPYRLISELGRGAMGVVYKGIRDDSQELVAIKFFKLLDHSPQAMTYQQRFFREAEAMGKIRHENVVKIYDSGRLGYLSYLVLEYIEGDDLRQVLKREQRVQLSLVKDWLCQLARGLAVIHEQGFVHRDLKPSNIMIQEGQLKIADFGLVRDNQSMDLTASNTMVGTPAYMSPEQIRGQKNIDGRSDLFSVGILAYELLSGQNPFAAINVPDTARAICNREPKRLDTLDPLIPSSIAALIDQCLEKDRNKRPESAKDLLEQLQRAEDSVSGQARRATSGSSKLTVLAMVVLLLGLTGAVLWGVLNARDLEDVKLKVRESQVAAQSLKSDLESERSRRTQLEGEKSQAALDSLDSSLKRVQDSLRLCEDLLGTRYSTGPRKKIAEGALKQLKGLERLLVRDEKASKRFGGKLGLAFFRLGTVIHSPLKCQLFETESEKYSYYKGLQWLRGSAKAGKLRVEWAEAELFVLLKRVLNNEPIDFPMSQLSDLSAAMSADRAALFTDARLRTLLFNESLTGAVKARFVKDAYEKLKRMPEFGMLELMFIAVLEKKYSHPYKGVDGLNLEWELGSSPGESRDSAYAREMVQYYASKMTATTIFDRGFNKRLRHTRRAFELYPDSLMAMIAFSDTLCIQVLGGLPMTRPRLLQLSEVVESYGHILDYAPTGFIKMDNNERVALTFRPLMMFYQVGEASLSYVYCERLLSRWKRHIPKRLEDILRAVKVLCDISRRGTGLGSLRRFDNKALLEELRGRSGSQPMSFELRVLELNSLYEKRQLDAQKYLAGMYQVYRTLRGFRHVNLEYFARLKLLMFFNYWSVSIENYDANDARVREAESVINQALEGLKNDLTEPISRALVKRIRARLASKK